MFCIEFEGYEAHCCFEGDFGCHSGCLGVVVSWVVMERLRAHEVWDFFYGSLSKLENVAFLSLFYLFIALE